MAEHDARRLLDFIVHNRLATLEEKQAEFATRAIDPDDQPDVMSSHEVQTEAEAAQRMFPAFLAGLRAGAQAGNAPLVLDDADPQQDEIASALIRFLVTPHLATVESEEIEPDHYRYRITLDWPG